MTTFDLDAFDALARARRTSLLVDTERAVPAELVDRLCTLATWAPNHKRTWPWRFACFTGQARAKLGEAFADEMVARSFGDEGKVAKTRTKYLRAPAVLVVGAARHDKPSLDAENRDAVAAGLQNLLLGATAAGLASFWSTAPLDDAAGALSLCGFDADLRLVGVVYLGWPSGAVEVPVRPPADVHHIG
jgi:nitroreductase